MKELYPSRNSAAFVFECTKGRGRLIGFFVKHTKDVCSYCGELLGLMAIHLILLAVNKCNPDLPGSVQIFSDCLGALNKIENLPPHRIPTKCNHSDILKNIMVLCSDLSSCRLYSHIKAHQDDNIQYGDLSQPAQLNCQVDYHAKKAIWEVGLVDEEITLRFPLKLVCVFLGKNRLTSDKGDALRFWVNRKLVKECFHERNILYAQAFDKVDWESIHLSLWRIPWLFQIWMCKQVMGISSANGNISWDKTIDPLCSGCGQVKETCSHILFCNHAGRVDALMKSIEILEHWLIKVDTDPELLSCIVEFAKEQISIAMTEICRDKAQRYRLMATDQDDIGWHQFIEGMVCHRARDIQETYSSVKGSNILSCQWAQGLVVKLLETTHGQWLYRCVHIHDKVAGTLIIASKEEIQRKIERQFELGTEDLLDVDQYLVEVNINDLERGSGEHQEYWLLAIRAAWKASLL
jgi:hypothetical protein